MAFEAVHLDQQLVQGLLALLVAERVAAAGAADRVELVDEDDAGAMAARIAEQLADARGADPGVHLDEVRSAREQERHPGLARDRARQQRFAGPGGADQQDALRNAAADRGEPIRLPQEIDDLLDLVLGLVHAGHVLERHHVGGAIREAGAQADRRNLSRGGPIDGEAEQHEEGGGDAECAPAERGRVGRRRDLDANLAGGPGR